MTGKTYISAEWLLDPYFKDSVESTEQKTASQTTSAEQVTKTTETSLSRKRSIFKLTVASVNKIKAEIMWALKFVTDGHSNNSWDHINSLFHVC